jgi:hypothetical protein
VLYPDSTGGADAEDIRKLSALSNLGASNEELQHQDAASCNMAGV